MTFVLSWSGFKAYTVVNTLKSTKIDRIKRKTISIEALKSTEVIVLIVCFRYMILVVFFLEFKNLEFFRR